MPKRQVPLYEEDEDYEPDSDFMEQFLINTNLREKKIQLSDEQEYPNEIQ
jgi:hypothetical protein